MKNTRILVNTSAAASALALTLLSTACDDGQYTIPVSGDRVPLQLSVSQLSDTRLNDTQWEAGDQIGVYLIDANGNYVDGATNIRYVIDPVSNACTVANADSIIILEKGATYSLMVYYPYSVDAGQSIWSSWYSVPDWDVQMDNPSSVDVLYATVNGISSNEPNVSISLARQSARIELNIFADESVNLENVTIRISDKNFPLRFNLSRAEWEYYISSSGDSIQIPVSVDGSRATASVIVPPTGYWEQLSPVIEIFVNETDVRTYPFPDDFVFEAGKSYTLNFSFSPVANIDGIVEQIEGMTESGSVPVVGYLGQPGVAAISEALKVLHNSGSEAKVTLDLTGMTNSVLPNFYECQYLDGVIIPEGITELKGNFSRCYDLRSLVIPASVTSIGEYTFFHCRSLESVTVADGNPAFKMVGDALYSIDGTKLISYCARTSEAPFTVPAAVTEIADCAFDASQITKVIFESDDNLTTIGKYGFAYCENLTSFRMPNSVTSVGTCLFENSSLSDFTFSSSLTTLPDGMFSNCKFTELVIPETVTVLDGSVFWACQSLGTLVFPASLAEIGLYLYMHCNALTTVCYCGTEKQRAAISDRSGITADDNITWVYNYNPETMGVANGHVYFDLGLPNGTKWAMTNVGARKSEDYGNYYAWGETTGYDEGKTDWGTYSFGTSTAMTKYTQTDNLVELEPEDDAATVNWGSSWRMPTKEELQELIDNCGSQVVTKDSGVVGYEFSAKNGNSIFLPLAGRCMTTDPYGVNEFGNYWSSSLVTEGEPYGIGAFSLVMDPVWNNFGLDGGCVRAYGMPVRAVLAE